MKVFSNAEAQVLQAMVKMNTPEMRPLLEFFTQLLEESKDAMILANADTYQRLQGRCGVLKEFVEAVRKAPEAIERLQK